VSDLAIEVRGLRKSYGSLEAVKGIDLEVRTGEVFALLGPNGAGKTTTVEILEGHRTRDAGDVSVLGFDPGRRPGDFRRRIGIVLQETGVERFLTVREAVEMYRGFYPHPRPADEVIEVVGLSPQKDQLVRKLSGGQQRRLDVAIGLAGDPDLLFLDEPTTGFDPSARRNAWGMIKNLRNLGKTILLTTHYMDEAQDLADTVSVINAGTIVAEGPPGAIGGRDVALTLVSFTLASGSPEPPRQLLSNFSRERGGYRGRADDPVRLLHELTGWALSAQVPLEDLHVARPTLEDVYLELTGENPGGDEVSER
jgi:ABC-2 type transport system ATP-binding protein